MLITTLLLILSLILLARSVIAVEQIRRRDEYITELKNKQREQLKSMAKNFDKEARSRIRKEADEEWAFLLKKCEKEGRSVSSQRRIEMLKNVIEYLKED